MFSSLSRKTAAARLVSTTRSAFLNNVRKFSTSTSPYSPYAASPYDVPPITNKTTAKEFADNFVAFCKNDIRPLDSRISEGFQHYLFKFGDYPLAASILFILYCKEMLIFSPEIIVAGTGITMITLALKRGAASIKEAFDGFRVETAEEYLLANRALASVVGLSDNLVNANMARPEVLKEERAELAAAAKKLIVARDLTRRQQFRNQIVAELDKLAAEDKKGAASAGGVRSAKVESNALVDSMLTEEFKDKFMLEALVLSGQPNAGWVDFRSVEEAIAKNLKK